MDECYHTLYLFKAAAVANERLHAILVLVTTIRGRDSGGNPLLEFSHRASGSKPFTQRQTSLPIQPDGAFVVQIIYWKRLFFLLKKIYYSILQERDTTNICKYSFI